VSPRSPAPGSAKKREEEQSAKEPEAGNGLEITLEHMRFRHLAWLGFGLVVGALLVWKLGTVGKWVGVALIAVGCWAAYQFARTLMFPPGAIVIGDDGAALPRGVCAGEPVKVKLGEVRHAYLLRRSVPWTRAAPVLVIEAGGTAYTYPRDWFVTEADQRRIVRELHARGVGAGAE